MKKKFQRCIQCDNPTGRTGSEDSIYVEVDGEEVGPLCEPCREAYKDQIGEGKEREP